MALIDEAVDIFTSRLLIQRWGYNLKTTPSFTFYAPPLFTGVGATEVEGKSSLVIFSSVPPEEVPETARWLELFSEIAGEVKYDPNRIDWRFSGVNVLARPAQGGDSVSNSSRSHPTGSIACAVVDLKKTSLMLSCSHILAASSSPKKGSDVIMEPGAATGGSSKRIGLLHDYVPLSTGAPNYFDAALCLPDKASDLSPGLRTIGAIAGFDASPTLNSAVQKHGWKTGHTRGSLRISKLSVLVPSRAGDLLFQNQYGVIGTNKGKNFAERGDSGALVVNDSNEAIGLLFAVASGIDLAYVNPIQPVLDYFKLSIL